MDQTTDNICNELGLTKTQFRMRQPNPALRMKTPLEAIAASKGRNEVMAILGRIEHGVIS
jgi:uncharacterized protein (DUF2384 family)